jgi:hypothetical protein
MSKWKIAVIVPAILLVMGPAQARHYRTAAVDVATEAAGLCSLASSYPPYIYPAPNWEPFFRRHVYRYGPVPTCLPIEGSVASVSQPPISVRY